MVELQKYEEELVDRVFDFLEYSFYKGDLKGFLDWLCWVHVLYFGLAKLIHYISRGLSFLGQGHLGNCMRLLSQHFLGAKKESYY